MPFEILSDSDVGEDFFALKSKKLLNICHKIWLFYCVWKNKVI